jgi:hypothetical protein
MLFYKKVIILFVVIVSTYIIWRLILKQNEVMKLSKQIKSNVFEGMIDSSGNSLSTSVVPNFFNTPDGELASLKRTNALNIQNVSMNKYGSLPLKQFVIKGSYNSAVTGNYVNEKMVAYVLQRGCRYLDFEIFLIKQVAVVSYSNDPNFNILKTDNTVPFSTILTTIITTNVNTPNNTDPIFINMRVKSYDPSVYQILAATINEVNKTGIVYNNNITENFTSSPEVTSPSFTSSPETTSPSFTSSPEVTSPSFTLSPESTSPPSFTSEITSEIENTFLFATPPPDSNSLPIVKSHNINTPFIDMPIINFKNKIVFIMDKTIVPNYAALCDCANKKNCYDLRNYISLESGSDMLIKKPYTIVLNQCWNPLKISNDNVHTNVSSMQLVVPDPVIPAKNAYSNPPPPSPYESSNPTLSDFIKQQGCQIVPFRFYLTDSYWSKTQPLADYEDFFDSQHSAFVPLGIALHYYQ